MVQTELQGKVAEYRGMVAKNRNISSILNQSHLQWGSVEFAGREAYLKGKIQVIIGDIYSALLERIDFAIKKNRQAWGIGYFVSVSRNCLEAIEHKTEGVGHHMFTVNLWIDSTAKEEDKTAYAIRVMHPDGTVRGYALADLERAVSELEASIAKYAIN